MVWERNHQGKMEFIGGKRAWSDVAQLAYQCEDFMQDDDDEQMADEEVSCYNCRYRRWTYSSFICMKKS